MSSSTRNTSAAYAQFSRSIGYSIFYRLLGIMSLLLVMAASLFLIIWYSFITGSLFIDGYMEDIYENINLPNFQEITYNGISFICQRVNSIFGRDIIYPPGVNIKKEPVEVIYESNSQDSESDLEVEDVTEQFKAEQEENKEVIDLTEQDDNDEKKQEIIDLTDEAEDKNKEDEQKEEHIASESSDSESTAPMGSTDSEEKKPKKKHHGGVKHGKGKHARINQLKHHEDDNEEWKALVDIASETLEMLNEKDKQEEDYTVIPDALEEE